VGDVSSEGKALGYLVVVLGFGRRYYGARDLRVCEEVVVEMQLEGYYPECAFLFKVT
jgi:hypothetical protein